MLRDPNPSARTSGLWMMQRLNLSIGRADLLPFLKIPDREAISFALQYLRNETNGHGLSHSEAKALLKNTEPLARLIGLKILYQNANS